MVYLVAQMVKNPSAYAEDPGLIPGWEYPQRRKWKLTPEFLPGESHAQGTCCCCC